jgi:extradiol dioxygenase family protein
MIIYENIYWVQDMETNKEFYGTFLSICWQDKRKKTVDFNIKGYKSMDFDLFGPDYLIVASDGAYQTIVVVFTPKNCSISRAIS